MREKDPTASWGALLTHIWRRLWVLTLFAALREDDKWASNYIWRHPSERSDFFFFFLQLTDSLSYKREKLTQEVFDCNVLVNYYFFWLSTFETTFMCEGFIQAEFRRLPLNCNYKTMCLHNDTFHVIIGLKCFLLNQRPVSHEDNRFFHKETLW